MRIAVFVRQCARSRFLLWNTWPVREAPPLPNLVSSLPRAHGTRVRRCQVPQARSRREGISREVCQHLFHLLVCQNRRSGSKRKYRESSDRIGHNLRLSTAPFALQSQDDTITLRFDIKRIAGAQAEPPADSTRQHHLAFG